ncbi:MAG: hypothetical protein Q4E88_02700 [Coriobacteriia bacterium]|nr:hypothetical protein [Coriobacteriia bacterium]
MNAEEALALAAAMGGGSGGGGNVDDVLVNGESVLGQDKKARIDLTKYQLTCLLHLELVINNAQETPITGATVTIKKDKDHAVYGTYEYNGVPIDISLPVGNEYTIICSNVSGCSAPFNEHITGVGGDIDLKMKYFDRPGIYGFHVNGSEADPAQAVTYLLDAIGATPAHMDFQTGIFNYGSWEDAFFFGKPCMVKRNGTRDYYVNPNDYSKKLDGTPSDYNNLNYDGNLMIEFPKFYIKVVPDEDDNNSFSVYIAAYKADNDFKCYPFLDMNGNEMDFCYIAAYNGSYDSNNRMRSISGTSIGYQQSGQTELDRARLNNITASEIEWNTEVKCDVDMINYLLILMGKNLNTQDVYGYGHYTGGSSAANLLNPGTMDTKGLFWGADADHTATGVKVFGIENWWGNQWRRFQGLVSDASKRYKMKLTYSTADGSTGTGYNSNGSGYLEPAVGVPNGYITKLDGANESMLPSSAGGSATTYECDYAYNGANMYALHGGACNGGLVCGAFALDLNYAFSRSNWNYGACLSCKPLVR